MEASTLKDKTARGLFWGGMSNGTVQLISMLFGIYLARTLDIEDYGLVGMLAIFTAIANTIINSGFSVALTNKKDAAQEDYNAVFWFGVIVSAALYIILFASAPLIARFYERPQLVLISRVLFISFLAGGIANVSHTVLYKHLMVKEQARIDIFCVILSGLVGVGMAFSGMAYWALVAQTVVYVCSNSIIKIIVAPWRPSFPVDLRPLKGMLSFSVKLFFTNIFLQINNNVLTLMLGKLFGEGTLGFYSQGNSWTTRCSSVLSGMVNAVSHPVLVQVSDERERLLRVLRKMIRFAAFISFPLMLGLGFVGGEFIPLAIGEKWLPAVPLLQVLCLQGAVAPITLLYTHILYTHGRSDLFLAGNLLQGVLQIALILLLASQGILVMVVAYVAACFLGLGYWHYQVHKMTGLTFMQLMNDVLPYLGITLLVFAAVRAVTLPIENAWLLLAAKIVLSAGGYCLILWKSKSVIFRESVEMLMKRRKEL
jgi:O-antigen/teichoic acid export membrane protein